MLNYGKIKNKAHCGEPNHIEKFMLNPYSVEDHQSLISQINATELLLETLKANLKQLEESELTRIADLFKTKFGIDVSSFVKQVGLKCDYMNIGYLLNHFGEQWEAKVNKLEELGFLKVHYMFFDPDDTNEEIELSKSEFIEYSTPNQDEMCIDPLLGEECTPQEFVSRHYRFVSTTDEYTNFLNKNTLLFSLQK